MQKRSILLALITLVSLSAFTQEDPTLFSVADINVPVSEFQYIYTKNNRDNADYSSASVAEYLDLYTRFKLKVKRARDLELDTISALQKELAGYRAQLAKSYLNDKEVIDKLTREVWDRMHTDLRVAHILFRTEPGASPEDVARVLDQASIASVRARNGENFGKLAMELSEDRNTAVKGGELGYLTCMLPSGFYDVENIIYSMKDGEVSTPVRSNLGYHVFKVIGRRPARGEIEAAHIFVRIKSDSSNAVAAQQKITALYQNLQNGGSFDELATTVSDDQQTARRGGYIGRFGINSYDPDFEEAAFALTTPGSISEPVRTRVGWHIIRLINRIELGSYEEEQNRLEARISRDERVESAKKAMIEKIRSESGLTEDAAARDTFIASLGEDFLTFQWTVPAGQAPLVRFADGTKKTTDDFAAYLRTKTRERMRAMKTETPQSVASSLYTQWLDDLCLEYEEERLEEKYPDFHALMREYEEGILLFEVTKMMVWDKASQDTAGLNKFFAGHREGYMWPERAEVVHVSVEGDQALKVTGKVQKLLAKHTIEAVAAKLNKKQQQVTFQRKRYLRDELTNLGLEWNSGYTTQTTTDAASGKQQFSKVTALLPPQPKALDEARGYVIADYQDALEKAWVEDLRMQYPVNVNEAALKSLIRK